MRSMVIPAMLAAVLAAGCGDREQAAQTDQEPVNPLRVRIIDSLPLLPRTRLMDTTGTAESERRMFLVPVVVDSIGPFYRREMSARGWREINYLADSTIMDLHMRRDSVNLWFHAVPAPPLINASHLTVLATGTLVPGTPVEDTLPRRRGSARP